MRVDWSVGQPDDHHRVLLAQRLDPSRLSLVAEGRDRVGTWELHDGPHPRIEDPDAVGERLILRSQGDGESETFSVGPALSTTETAVVSSAGVGIGQHRREFLMARCTPAVVAAQIVFDDASHHVVHAVASRTTGQRWIVLAVDPHRKPARISFTDDSGSVLHAQVITPRPRHGSPDTQLETTRTQPLRAETELDGS